MTWWDTYAEDGHVFLQLGDEYAPFTELTPEEARDLAAELIERADYLDAQTAETPSGA